MPALSRIKTLLTDFLFPKTRQILELESLSIETLIKTLPAAERSEDKNTVAIFDYDHPVMKEMIWTLKYGGNRCMAEKFGEILYDTINQELADLVLFEKWTRPVILIPVPMSDKRLFERGWNQSELLTKEIARRDDGKMFKHLPGQIVKLHHTESQTKTTSRNERLKNITNSMKVLNPSLIEDQCIVIVDDVTTTGATFAEVRRVLKDAGAKKILCVAVAH